MRGARRGAATVRAVALALVVALAAAATAGWWAWRNVVQAERVAPVVVPTQIEIEHVPPMAAPAPVAVELPQDPIEALWCSKGPEVVVAATEAVDLATASASAQAMRRALLRCEALLAVGRVEQALEANRGLCAQLAKPTAAQACEPLALEQHARIRTAAGEANLLKQEERLRACVEARQGVHGDVPAEAWGTLGTLQKSRGECDAALENYARALAGLDLDAWTRLKRLAPWRMQTLALVALDRADCLATLGRMDEARKAAIAVAADLAVALGEGDPLAEQAADLREQLIRGQ